MKASERPRSEDFVVEEVLREKLLPRGSFAVFRVTKRLLTTTELQFLLAQQFNLPPKSVVFPALKDMRAVATQHFSVRGQVPPQVKGDGYKASLLGYMSRPLSPSDLLGNRFTITVRSLTATEVQAIIERSRLLESNGMPNYFDQQRFGSLTEKGTFIGKAILLGDAEGALKAYLAEPSPADQPDIRRMKAFAAEHWGDWPAIFEQAPRSNHRSLLTFLKDHPADFRKALNLVTPRLLPLLLEAYQSFLWNRIASLTLKHYLGAEGYMSSSLFIAGERLTLYSSASTKALQQLRNVQIPLLNHRGVFPDRVIAKIAEDVLAVEGLTLDQFKARLLKRAYLPKSSRPLLVFPQQVKAQLEKWQDSSKAGLRLGFFLPPGSYATLVLKVLSAGQ